MEQFKHAVDLVRGSAPLAPATDPRRGPLTLGDDRRPTSSPQTPFRNIPLRASHLETMRIVSHNRNDARSRSFDMLRTQVLQTMDAEGFQFLGISSPTAGCGKTVTACNLALSIARLPERSVMLIDLDMRKPMVATYLGIPSDYGVLSVLQGRQALSDAMVQAGIEREQALVLPGEQSNESSEWLASPATATLLQTIKRDYPSQIVLLDLPPVLAGDDFLSILPQLQSILLVAAAGATSVSEIKECSKHLKDTPLVRVVLNKITEREPTAPYHEYY